VPDWTAISSGATAAGTLVLAVATYSAVRSANRSARAAERSLLAGQRPILIPSRDDDPVELSRFGDGVILRIPGHGCAVEVHDGRLYMGCALRNGGAGVAVLHSWKADIIERIAVAEPPELDAMRRQLRDIYIPAGETGFWQGAIRNRDDEYLATLTEAAESGQRIVVDILYGDHEGGQRTIARFGISSAGPEDDGGEVRGRCEVLRYWNIDGDDPR
jgi:hypothetical protein